MITWELAFLIEWHFMRLTQLLPLWAHCSPQAAIFSYWPLCSYVSCLEAQSL